MKHLVITLICSVFGLSAFATADYRTTAAKADRFFEAGEWASAQALYSIMIDQRHDADSAYVKAIVASSILSDSASASHFLTDAMKAGISFTWLMDQVKSTSFAIGKADVYEDFLLRSQRDCPWLHRAIDAELLDYYTFRDNGEKMIVYAEKMLAGLPESTKYLSALAAGFCLKGDFNSAVGIWNKILGIEPDNYDILLKIGNFYRITGDNLQGDEFLARAAKIHPTPFVDNCLTNR